MALRSLRAEGESALAAAQAKRGNLKREHSATRGELIRERGDHGRTADHPAEIPPRGWKDILVRTYRSISETASRHWRRASPITSCWRCFPASPPWSRSTA
jgi:hypothetical protein